MTECNCKEYTIACAGEWEETVVCKECGVPVISEKIIQALHTVKVLSAENKALLRHGSFMDYKGRCEQYIHCRLCDSKWLWENDEPSKHKDDCPLKGK